MSRVARTPQKKASQASHTHTQNPFRPIGSGESSLIYMRFEFRGVVGQYCRNNERVSPRTLLSCVMARYNARLCRVMGTFEVSGSWSGFDIGVRFVRVVCLVCWENSYKVSFDEISLGGGFFSFVLMIKIVFVLFDCSGVF